MLIWIFCAVSGLFTGYVVVRTAGRLKRAGMFAGLTAAAVITAGLLAQLAHPQTPEAVSNSAAHGAPMVGIAYMMFAIVICVFAAGAFVFFHQARK